MIFLHLTIPWWLDNCKLCFFWLFGMYKYIKVSLYFLGYTFIVNLDDEYVQLDVAIICFVFCMNWTKETKKKTGFERQRKKRLAFNSFYRTQDNTRPICGSIRDRHNFADVRFFKKSPFLVLFALRLQCTISIGIPLFIMT